MHKYIFIYVCMLVCVCVHVCVCLCLSIYLQIYLHMYASLHIYIDVRMFACLPTQHAHYVIKHHRHIYSRLQIGWQKILRKFLKTFNLVPGEAGCSLDGMLIGFIMSDAHWIHHEYHVITNTVIMGRILVR